MTVNAAILTVAMVTLFHWSSVDAGAIVWRRANLSDTGNPTWSYAKDSDMGPEHWKDNFLDCGGVMQSPINIDLQHVLYDPNLQFFDTSDYSKTTGVQMELHNVGGHTAEVSYSGSPILLRGGSLPDVYQVDQFHFHWGKVDTRGSEHAMDEDFFPMEMHIVHHQVHLDNIAHALRHPHGLAVLGFFFKIGKENPNMEPLLKHFDKIQMPGNETDIDSFKLSDLIPATEEMSFFRYMGSLTTPPCYETVVWSLAVTPIEISESQIEKFRYLFKNIKEELLVDGFRPLQKLNRRTVTTTATKYKDGGGSGVALTASLVAVTLGVLLASPLTL